MAQAKYGREAQAPNDFFAGFALSSDSGYLPGVNMDPRFSERIEFTELIARHRTLQNVLVGLEKEVGDGNLTRARDLQTQITREAKVGFEAAKATKFLAIAALNAHRVHSLEMKELPTLHGLFESRKPALVLRFKSTTGSEAWVYLPRNDDTPHPVLRDLNQQKWIPFRLENLRWSAMNLQLWFRDIARHLEKLEASPYVDGPHAVNEWLDLIYRARLNYEINPNEG